MNAIDLIRLTEPSHWTEINLSSTAAQWIKNPAGEITQTKILDGDDGAILLLQESEHDFDLMALRVRTSKAGVVGVVFGFIDAENFTLFSLTRATNNVATGKLMIRQRGQSSVLYEKELDNSKQEVAIALLNLNDTVAIQVDGTEFFNWKNKLEGFSKTGLYCHQTDDACFLNLMTGALAVISNEVITDTTPEIQPMSLEAPVVTAPLQTKTLPSFLNIGTPHSETQVEFGEVFTVPLDSFYVSLYRNYGEKSVPLTSDDIQAAEPGSIASQIRRNGSLLKTWDLSPDKFLLVSATGITDFDELKFPFDSLYSAMYDKHTMRPIQEHTQKITSNEIKGYLPTGKNLISISIKVESTQYLLESNTKISSAKLYETQYSNSGNWCIGRDAYGNSLRILSAASGEEIKTLVVPPASGLVMQAMEAGLFSPDDSVYLGFFSKSSGNATAILIWNTSSGNLIRELHFNNGPEREVVFSNDGKRALFKTSETDYLYDTTSWALLQSFAANRNHRPHFTPDSSYLVLYGQSTQGVTVVDASTGTIYKQTSTGADMALAIGNNCILYAYGEQLYRWDYTTDILDEVSTISDERIVDFGISTNLELIFLKKARQVDLLTGAGVLVKSISLPSSYSDTKYMFSPDNNRLIPVGMASSADVYVVNLTTGIVLTPATNIQDIDNMKCTSDGKIMLITTDNETIYVLDTSTGIPRHTFSEDGLLRADLSPDGKHISIQKTVVTIASVDPATKKVKSKIPFNPKGFDNLTYALSPDGEKILYPDSLVSACLWDFTTESQVLLPKLTNINIGIGKVIFSPDSKRILAISADGTRLKETLLPAGSTRLYDAVEGNNTQEIKAICYYPDGKKILTYHQDKTLRAWSTTGATTSTLVFTDQGAERGRQIGISHDASRVYIMRDLSIGIYNLQSGTEVQVIELGQSLEAAGIWFTPDGRGLAVTQDTEVNVYQLMTTAAADQQTATTDELPPSHSFLLDYRPKRWYRGMKLARQEELHFNSLALNFQDAIASLRTSMFTPPSASAENSPSLHEQIRDGLYMINAYQQKFHEANTQVNKALDSMRAISSELRTNGYNLVFKGQADQLYTYVGGKKKYLPGKLKIEDDLTEKGYTFAIVGGKPKVKAYDAMPVTIQDLADNMQWAKFWGNLRAWLNNSDALSDEKKKVFEEQSRELVNNESNAKIQREKARLEKDIQVARDAAKKITDQMAFIESEKKTWQSDKQIIQNLNLSSYLTLYNSLADKKGQLKKLAAGLQQSTATWGDSKSVRYVVSQLLWITITATKTLHRTNHQYVIAYNATGYKYSTAWSYSHGEFGYYNEIAPLSISAFQQKLMGVCDKAIADLNESYSKADTDLRKTNNELLFHNTAVEELEARALAEQRKKFVQYWNDPNQFGAFDMIENQISPEADPLADLLVSLQYPDEDESANTSTKPSDTYVPMEQLKWKTDFFNFSGDRFYNEEGLTLQSYLEFLKGSKSRRVAIFPKMEDDGTINTEAFTAVINPQPAVNLDEDLPVIKFVETYRVGIRWTGYHLGELSHTENLFPNQSKEIRVERTLRLTRRQEESKLTSQTQTTKNSTSFEENLAKEISLKETTSAEQEDINKTTVKTGAETTSENQTTTSEDFSIRADMKSPIPGVQGGIESKYGKKNDSTNKNSRKDTLEQVNENQGRTATKESKEAFSKDTSNTIRKVASETSQENKVEIRVSTSEESSSTDSRIETIKLENPNLGRTINYHFFQIQNGYEVTTTLIDVKIYVDMNREIIKGSTVTDIRIFDLEELGKIFADESEDPRYLLTAAIIARQAFKNYLAGVPGIGRGNGALSIHPSFLVNRDFFDTVNFTKKLTKTDIKSENLLRELYEAMSYLKQVPFEFHEREVNPPKEFFINAGAYYLDSEIGSMPATEKYLEDRREIETSKQKALVDQLREQTNQKVFFAPFSSNGTESGVDVK
jgi:WD40 repeat protein